MPESTHEQQMALLFVPLFMKPGIHKLTLLFDAAVACHVYRSTDQRGQLGAVMISYSHITHVDRGWSMRLCFHIGLFGVALTGVVRANDQSNKRDKPA
jgi:hypothetical protein